MEDTRRENLKAILEEALKPVHDRLDQIEERLERLEK